MLAVDRLEFLPFRLSIAPDRPTRNKQVNKPEQVNVNSQNVMVTAEREVVVLVRSENRSSGGVCAGCRGVEKSLAVSFAGSGALTL